MEHEHLNAILSRLPLRHQAALQWFAENAGTVRPWPKAVADPEGEGELLLASKAKGIYKPVWSTYALSVRQSLGGPYPDRDPIFRSDGTWLYSYFQENADASARDNEFTNRGLLECWRDGIPVGVLRQVSAKPNSRYQILGLALVAGWDGGYFFLEGFAPSGHAHPRGPAGEVELLTQDQERQSFNSGGFDPSNVIDARERAIAQIVRRRGQPEFRRRLITAYGGRCAISKCDAVEALEAAHIVPYRGPDTNALENGLLLRADLHTLFDLGLVAIDPETMGVLLAPALVSTSYGELAGNSLHVPSDPKLRPNIEALRLRRQWTGL
jgi:putative restriction endonuclease